MRIALAAVVLLATAVPAPAQAASVRLTDCTTALEPAGRTATFAARATALRDSERIQVRFTLQVREPDARGWRRVVAAGLDAWLTSDRGVRRYTYERTVTHLGAPAAYRAVVRFRWLGADGRVIERERARSRACRQPDLRPDLAVRRIDAAPAPPGEEARFAVTVRNGGRSVAEAFTVALRVGDRPLAPLEVVALGPGEERVVTFAGPACEAGEFLLATADAADAVAERDEGDNAQRVACLP